MTGSSSTSKTDEGQAAGPEAEQAATTPGEEAGESRPEIDPAGDEAVGQTDDAGEGLDDEPAETAPSARSSVAVGAAAVISAGLGLASVTGTWLSDLMSSRQELIGQINSGQTSPPAEQVAAIYGSPWHTEALFNGFFALAAIIVAAVALLLPAFTKSDQESPAWMRALAFGGLAFGTLGLVIAAAMWFDVFTELPEVPAM